MRSSRAGESDGGFHGRSSTAERIVRFRRSSIVAGLASAVVTWSIAACMPIDTMLDTHTPVPSCSSGARREIAEHWANVPERIKLAIERGQVVRGMPQPLIPDLCAGRYEKLSDNTWVLRHQDRPYQWIDVYLYFASVESTQPTLQAIIERGAILAPSP